MSGSTTPSCAPSPESPSEVRLLITKETNTEENPTTTQYFVESNALLPYDHDDFHYHHSNQPECIDSACTITQQQVIYCEELAYAHSRQSLYPRHPIFEILRPICDPRYAYRRASLNPEEVRNLWTNLPINTIPSNSPFTTIIEEPVYEGVHARLYVDLPKAGCNYMCLGARVIYGVSNDLPINYRVEDCLEDNNLTALWLLEPYHDSTGAPIDGQTCRDYPTIIVSGASYYNTIVPRLNRQYCDTQLLHYRRQHVAQMYACS